MKCNDCGERLDRPGQWTAAHTAEAISAGWLMWYSERDGLGDPGTREGDVRCPKCAATRMSATDRRMCPVLVDGAQCKNWGQRAFGWMCYFHRDGGNSPVSPDGSAEPSKTGGAR